MLGDFNTRFLFSSSGTRGYFAEHEHLSLLRGYDDRMICDGEYVKVDLESETFRPGRFFSADSTIVKTGVQLRNYEPLLPALKSGEPIGSKPQQVKLSLDAVLQTTLQNALREHAEESFKKNAALRISVVVLDAREGDLLASAVYPLPDQQYLQNLSDDELSVYRDADRPSGWRAYTDMDLGLYYHTEPGSTAKVMTSIAALRKEGASVADAMISVDKKECIRTGEPYGEIDMAEALRVSSNPYFIHLLNSRDLYSTLDTLYAALNCHIVDPESAERDRAISSYTRYINSGSKRKLNEGGFPRCWNWAWGQGDLKATPLSLALAASIPANGGYLPQVKYLYDEKSYIPQKRVLRQSEATKLRKMLSRVTNIRGIDGGKTGTPQRAWGKQHPKYNDGWFVCFIDDVSLGGKADDKSTISVAIRMERGPQSSQANNVARNVVLPVLRNLDYIE
jgi:cell division protein FtsI/penicillin-binding protein 2